MKRQKNKKEKIYQFIEKLGYITAWQTFNVVLLLTVIRNNFIKKRKKDEKRERNQARKQ